MAFKQHYVNVLTLAGHRAALEVLEETGEASRWKRDALPTAAGIKMHDLQVHDFLLTAMAECAVPPWAIWNVKDDHQMAELKMEYGFGFETTPDGYFIISNRDTHHDFAHFFEIDLGSMTVDSPKHPDVANKIPAYGRYITGRYDTDFGGLPRPIVLILTSGPKRQQSILDAIKAANGGGAYWVATFLDLATYGFFGTFWRVCTEPEPRSLLDRCLA